MMKVLVDIPDDVLAELAQRVADHIAPLLKRPQRSPESDQIFDVRGLAEYLGVRRQFVYQLLAQAAVPFFKVGRYPRFRRKEIDAWISARSVPASAAPSRAFRVVKP